MKKPYSVLLLYPDYMSDGVETYYAHVEASTPQAAVKLARQGCMTDNEDSITDAEDLRELLTIEGHHMGVA